MGGKNKGKSRSPIKQYHKQYLKRNKLILYREGFVKLDNIINLFFVNYQKLTRTSVNCARLWVGVMHIRTIMTNAVTSLYDQPRYLSYEYRKLRLNELNLHVRQCRLMVSKAVQYIVIYRKHHDENWRFQRKAFLEEHSKELYEKMEEQMHLWKEFLIKAYAVAPEVKKAFNRHLDLEERRARQALVDVEPLSDIGFKNDQYIQVLKNMYEDRDQERIQRSDFLLLRIQVNIVQDILGLYELAKDYGGRLPVKHTIVDTVHTFLNETVDKKILEDDETVWPHQKGLKDFGPFEAITLKQPTRYIEVFPDKDKSGNMRYRIKPEYFMVKTMHIFEGTLGKATKLHKVSFSPHIRKVLNIHKSATHFAWFFPVWAPAEIEEDVLKRFIKKGEALANDGSPLHALVLYGGFGYFNAEGDLIDLKGVVFGDDLFYDGPYFVQNAGAFEKLDEAGVRMEKVTFNRYRKEGAADYGFVNGGDSTLMKLPQHKEDFGPQQWEFTGAFFFRYDNTQHPEWDEADYFKGGRRSYFQELTFDELDLKTQKNNNTPVLNKLKYLAGRYEQEWTRERFERKRAEEEDANISSYWAGKEGLNVSVQFKAKGNKKFGLF